MARPIPDAALVRLRAAQDRSFDREGIPMFLVLTRTSASMPAPPPTAVVEGLALAAELADLHEQLFPTRRSDDLGCLTSTVQALTVGTFEPEPTL